MLPPHNPPPRLSTPAPPCGQHMREAAERRQQLELEHEQALAVLNAKQQEIDLLQKVRELRVHNTHSTRGLGFLVCPACACVMSQRAFCQALVRYIQSNKGESQLKNVYYRERSKE